MGKHLLIVAGDKFNDLTAIRSVRVDGKHGHVWEFDCVCGSKRIAKSAAVIRNRVKSCGCAWRRPSSPSRHYHCSLCKTHKPYSDFYIRGNGAPHGYCKECSPNHHVKYKSQDGGRVTCMFNALKANAHKRKIHFILLKSDIAALAEKQNWKCAQTGIDLDMSLGTGSPRPFGPTVDRIDNARGYEPGNIQLVCYIYNMAKNRFSDADVLTFAHALAEHQHSLPVNKPKLRIVV